MIWRKAYPTQLLFDKLRLPTDSKTVVYYRESEKEILIRYTYLQTSISISDQKKYIIPLMLDDRIVECSPELSVSIEENYKKNSRIT